MKKTVPLLMLLVMLIALFPVTPKADTEDPGNGYYYQQLNGFQKEIYHYILSGEKPAGQYSVHSKTDLSLYSEEQLARLIKDAGAACDLENPEKTAWFSYISFESYDEATNCVTVSIWTNEEYDAERMKLVSSLLDTIAEKADPSWDRYTKAKYIATTVSSSMVYFDDVYVYQSAPVQNYEKQHLVGVLNGTAVCEGYSELFVAIANRIGLPCVEVASKGHSFVHIQMEDGNWYGQDGQNELSLEGSSMFAGVQYEWGLENIYELWDGAFEYLVQPQRAENDYRYDEPEPQVETVDVQKVVAGFDYGEPEFLYSINSDGTSCTITGYKGAQRGDLILPNEIDGLTVTAIGDGAFAFCRFFDGSLSIPDSVTSIGDSAFTHCSGLKGDIKLPDKLKEIGNGAFSSCSGIEGKIIYNSCLGSIGSGAFSECSGLTEGLSLPDSVMSVGSNAFYHCNSLQGIVHIPDALENNWNAHVVSDGPTILGFDVSDQNSFYSVVSGILYSKDGTILFQCPAGYAGEVTIPEGTITVSDLAFYQCKRVTTVHFPSTLKEIGYMAFCDMEGIEQKDLRLPECIESVGSRAFRSWPSSGTLYYPTTDQVESEVFEYANNFDTIIIPDGVTALPAFCFQYCVKAHNIVVPASVESFGYNCFDFYTDIHFYVQEGSKAETYISENDQNGNYHIHYLSDPSGALPFGTCGENLTWSFDEATGNLAITGTGAMADFDETECPWSDLADRIAQVELPEGLTNIGRLAFYGCSKLTSVHIPSTVTVIGQMAFEGCAALTRVDLPDGLATIEMEAFYECSKLSDISIPDTVNEIGAYAFAFCSSLTSITIPEGVVELPEGNFWSCSSLTSITIPRSMVRIGTIAFTDCTALASVTIDDGLTEVVHDAFRGTAWWEAQPDGPVYLDYVFLGCKNTLPKVLEIVPGTRILATRSLLDLEETLTEITLPASVRYIGDGTFGRESALKTVTYLGSEERAAALKESVGVDNEALLSATWNYGIPTSGTCGENLAWSFDEATGKLTIQGTGEMDEFDLTGLPWQELRDKITSVSLPEGLTTIGYGAFDQCEKITSIDLPDGLTKIGDAAFFGCRGLTSVHIPGTVRTIGQMAFEGCVELTSVTVPNGITTIERDTFSFCIRLASITLPDSLTSIGVDAFNTCSALTSIVIPDGVISIDDYAFYDCDGLTSITLPVSITRIGMEAFNVEEDGADLTVCYLGTKEQQAKIDIAEENGRLMSAEWHCADACAQGHTPGEPVRENEKAATCAAEGSYDEVVYCKICGEEISRVTEAIPKTDEHTPGEAQRENEVAPSCQEGGYDMVVRCTVCGEIISSEHTAVPATGEHTPGEPVKENEVKATGSAQGSYDEVVYCSVCGEEISRETKYTSKTSKGMTLTQEPQDATIRNKQKATFTVKVSGSKLTYQWYYRKNASASWKKVSGGTKAKLSVAGSTSNSGYQYYCVIKNGKGTLKSKVVTLTVNLFPPEISVQPEDQNIHVGEKAQFAVEATGDGLTYQWYYKKSASATKWTKVSKATKATYSVKGTIANNGYQYRCLIKNADGKQYTDAVTLNVDYHLPTIAAQPTIPKSVKKNKTVTLTVEAENIYDEALTYQWYYRKSASAKWTKVKKATEPTYTFKATAKLNGYQYKCDVSNKDGTVSTKTLKLKVK